MNSRGWNSFWFKEVGPEALGLGRLLFFAAVFYMHWDATLQGWIEYEKPEFWQPISFFQFLNYDSLNEDLYRWMATAWPVSLVLAGLGIFTRGTVLLAALQAILIFGWPHNFGKIHHSTHSVVLVLLILSLCRCGDAFSVDAWIKRALNLDKNEKSLDYYWPIQLIRVYVISIYVAAGWQKIRLSGLDWLSSENMSYLIVSRSTTTEFGYWVADIPELCAILAVVTVFVQAFSFLAFVHWRLAIFFVPACFSFHIGTYLIMGEEGQFFSYWLPYVFWLPFHSLWKNWSSPGPQFSNS